MEIREILIIGGGIIGMAIGLELRQRGLPVTILRRNLTEAAAHAAAGMLAPQAEGIEPGPMQRLCIESRDLYPSWAQKLEALTGREIGYWPCGIMAPTYNRSELNHNPDNWLDVKGLAKIQSGLADPVVGGWWFRSDAQVDNRQVAQALQIGLQELGVEVREGVNVEAIVQNAQSVQYLQTNQGNWQAQHYILAAGAWSGRLQSVPVNPCKGQLLSVQVPDRENLPLTTVLFGSEIYIVPRKDGRIIVGATSEQVGFTSGNTAGGIKQLLQAAIRLFPAIEGYEITETWWGYRPETPDELPILGKSELENLTLATGHYRNGILLTPITAQLIADHIIDRRDDEFLNAFGRSRFL